MTETWLGTIPALCMIPIILGCWLYMLGGRRGKWKRRFIGSLVVSSSIFLCSYLLGSFDWLLLLIYPLTIGAFVLGYGSSVLKTKILKRSTVVAASLVSGILMAYIFNAWWVLPAEAFIAMVTVYLGVKNPIQAAPEEFFVCLFLWAPKLMYPFV